MKRGPLRSVRAKLIATTMLVFGLLIFLLGALLSASSRRALLSSMDADLERRGLDFAKNIAHGPPGGPRRFPHGGEGPHGDHDRRSDHLGDQFFDPHGPDPFEGARPLMGSGPLMGSAPETGPGAEVGAGPARGGGSLAARGPGSLGGPVSIGGPGSEGRRDPAWIAPAAIPLDRDPSSHAAIQRAYDYAAYLRAAKGEPNFKTVVVEGEPRRLYSTPVRIGGAIVGVVQVASSLAPGLSAWDSQRLMLLRLVLPLGLALGAIASFVVVNGLLKPLRHLTVEAERIGQEGFGERLVPQGADEFASLVGTLNGMLERLEDHYSKEHETNRRLQETIEQQRRFTSDASHELKTPLSVIKAHLGILKSSHATVAEESESIGAMDEGANRMTMLIRDLLVLARTDAGKAEVRTPCALDEVVAKAIRLAPGAQERVLFTGQAGAQVLASDEDLTRVFINIIDNALKHSGSPEPIEIGMRVDGDSVTVSVQDHGEGIAAAHLPHLFERFYRTDQSRTSDTGGSGLGLAICEQIVKSHGGEIWASSEMGKGACFSVRLPRYPGPDNSAHPPSA